MGTSRPGFREAGSNPLETPSDELLELIGVREEEQSRERGLRREDGFLLADLCPRGVLLVRRKGRDRSDQVDEESEGEDLLLDPLRFPGMELLLIQAGSLDQPVELFDLPAELVDARQVRSRELGLFQIGDENEGVLAELAEDGNPHPDRLLGLVVSHGRSERDMAELLAACHELLHLLEGVGLRHPQDEVDLPLHQRMDEIERGIPAIREEDVSGLDPREELHGLIAFAAVLWGRGDIVDLPGEHVVERGDESLRAVATGRCSEVVEELIAAIEVELAAVDGEQSEASIAELLASFPLEFVRRFVHQVPDEGGLDLLPRLAERLRRNRRLGPELDAVSSALVPEGSEEQRVAPQPRVGDHVEEKEDEDVRREHAITGEVLLSTPKKWTVWAGQKGQRSC